MRYSNLCLQRGVSVILSAKHTLRYDHFLCHLFLKILHITPIMLIMIHLGTADSVCVARKKREKVEGGEII